MLRAGEPLASVEQAIAEAPLPEDEQAALWLVAWSLGERPVWRRSVRAQFTSPARA
jgi:hypothetical protein